MVKVFLLMFGCYIYVWPVEQFCSQLVINIVSSLMYGLSNFDKIGEISLEHSSCSNAARKSLILV